MSHKAALISILVLVIASGCTIGPTNQCEPRPIRIAQPTAEEPISIARPHILGDEQGGVQKAVFHNTINTTTISARCMWNTSITHVGDVNTTPLTSIYHINANKPKWYICSIEANLINGTRMSAEFIYEQEETAHEQEETTRTNKSAAELDIGPCLEGVI